MNNYHVLLIVSITFSVYFRMYEQY